MFVCVPCLTNADGQIRLLTSGTVLGLYDDMQAAQDCLITRGYCLAQGSITSLWQSQENEPLGYYILPLIQIIKPTQT